ncbi:ester cyclase [Nocardioides panaciterrulae]|uniref:Putative ester cyclase n=1 Tax=Nocardioides panaciterrulae TaxID=661492 RepID=A0A7Y9E3D6_9ACTN|nr:ester cyclase [Nocardioides panaciterrulae]NYD40483.1 putative ester cyclase [Nocardioides panaciterrulae]
MPSNAEIARDLYLSWNERDFDRAAEMVKPDSEIIVVGTGEKFIGPDGVRRYDSNWAEGFPDGEITVDNILDAGDCVVVEFTGRGTHTGTLPTSMGPIPPTGRQLTLSLCDVLEFQEGKVKRQRSYFDTGSMMMQLGLLPEQAEAAQEAPR